MGYVLWVAMSGCSVSLRQGGGDVGRGGLVGTWGVISGGHRMGVV